MKRYAWAMFAVELWAQCARAQAQPDDALSGVLKIQSQAAPCLTESALRERVRHWLAPRAAAKGVTVVLDAGADPPAFRVWRGGAIIAVRRFALLPSVCADRLDAIALPVALAIEQATEGNAAPAAGAAPAQSAPASTANPTNAPPANSGGVATADTPAEPGQTEVDATGSPAADAAGSAAATVNPSGSEQAAAVARTADANEDADAAAKAEAEADTAEAEADAVDAGNSNTGAASRWRLFAAGSLLFEALPHTVVAVEAGPELLLGQHLSVSLGALVTAQTEHTLGSLQSHAQVFGGRALLCAGWPLGGFGLDACTGAIGGAVAVNTSGTDTRQTLAWVAGMARAALRYPARGLISLRLGVSGLFNLVRPRLLASGQVPRATSAGVVGAETSLELLIALP